VPGGFFVNINSGQVLGFGLEPVGDVLIDAGGLRHSTPDTGEGRLRRPPLVMLAACVGTALGVVWMAQRSK
jgi:hypothetical protein